MTIKSVYRIEDDRIQFDAYPFYHSSLRKNKTLTVDKIISFDQTTYPCSMEVVGEEIIFFNHDDKQEIKQFCQKHGITALERTDVWELLCREYLDTEFDESDCEKVQTTLRHLGISQMEQRRIRKQINWTLTGSLEWIYLGHWDLLAMKQARNPLYCLNGAAFYWWTMQVALRA